MDDKCFHCGVSDDERPLTKCVICFHYYCKECEFDRGGRVFYSKHCYEFFFFAVEE